MSKLNHWPYPVKQSDPPLSPRETLPTMYDLPSEDPEEPGLPDEYHALQPQFLNRTFRTAIYPPEEIFTGTDLNLYYDVSHSLWYKRPDWFLVVGVPRLYDEIDLRSSYVVWQEGINPFVVVELLSPGTEKEDLGSADTSGDALPKNNGQIARETPPTKWEVYEQILRVPYYVVFSRYTNQLRCFKLLGGHYQEQVLEPDHPRLWISELKVGLGLWQGEFEGITRQWLRWYDEQGWVPTDTEQEQQDKEIALKRLQQERQEKEIALKRAEQERQRAEQAESQLQQVALNLLRQGMTQEQVASLTGLSEEQIQKIVDECE